MIVFTVKRYSFPTYEASKRFILTTITTLTTGFISSGYEKLSVIIPNILPIKMSVPDYKENNHNYEAQFGCGAVESKSGFDDDPETGSTDPGKQI